METARGSEQQKFASANSVGNGRMQPTGTGVFERIRQNGSGAKQLVYDTALTDTIREQEAKPRVSQTE